MKTGNRNFISLAGAVASAVALSSASFSASAEVINVPCDTGNLINAIKQANTSPTDTVLNLAPLCTYTLTAIQAETATSTPASYYSPSGSITTAPEYYSPSGLPPVVSSTVGGKLSVNGRGAKIVRSTVTGTPSFRILKVEAGGDVTVDDLSFQGGQLIEPGVFFGDWRVFSRGAGIYADHSHLTLRHVRITHNMAREGGGIFASGNVQLVETTIDDNTALIAAGANLQGTVTLLNSRIVDNVAKTSAGGAFLTGRVTVEGSTIANNEAYNFGDGYAGGIEVLAIGENSDEIRLINTTISGNRSADAGGLFIYSRWDTAAPAVHLNNLTIANNTGHSTSGSNPLSGIGGLFLRTVSGSGVDDFSNVVVKNSIFADNYPSNCNAIPAASGTNFATSGSYGNCGAGFTQVSPDTLKLDSLGENGGTTETHALLPGSVAIDAATDCTTVDGHAVTTDQRGTARPQSNACDVGAFERGNEPSVVNSLVAFTVVKGTAGMANDSVGCPYLGVRKYRFSALLTNRSNKSDPVTLSNLYMQVRTLSGDSLLFLDGGIPGKLYSEGERVALPLADGYADGRLAPSETETVTINICLGSPPSTAPSKLFKLLVDVVGKTQ